MAFSVSFLQAQTLERKTGSFTRLIVSPHINLVLIQGTEESVTIKYEGVSESDININHHRNTLRIFLDGARFTEKRKRVQRDGETYKEDVYRHAVITAYVTYRDLSKLVIRGNQEVDIQGAITGKKFKLAAYGETEITLATLTVDKFKAALYGQHNIKIKAGQVESQKYKLFGENKIDAQALQSNDIASTTYGESRLRFNGNDRLKLVTIGESNVMVKGNMDIRRFTIGQIELKH